MKLFNHYKNKPYKLLGEARHSESMETMVIYETRYENTGGKIWVRPKEMFFENVTIEGKTIPRFEKIALDLHSTTEVTSKEVETIAPIMQAAFGEWNSDSFYETFSSHKKFHLVVGSVGEQAVGFKLGYERDRTEFYSWLGGVDPKFRGLGIAAELMGAQHEWCRKAGYKKISTNTRNRFRQMLLLNIRNGFDIIGTKVSDKGELAIMLEKLL